MKKWEDLCLPAIKDSHLKAMLELQYTHYHYSRMKESVLKPFGVSFEQFNALKVLQSEYPQSVSLKEVQMQLINQTKNTTRLVDKLTKSGFVISKINPENKRQLQIKITPKGLEILSKIEEPLDKLLAKIKSVISEEEAKQLSSILSKIYSLPG